MSPNQPKTPMRSLRIDDGLWQQVRERAEAEGRTVTALIRDALRQYLAR